MGGLMLLDMGKQAVKEIIKLFAYHLKMGIKCKTCATVKEKKNQNMFIFIWRDCD